MDSVLVTIRLFGLLSEYDGPRQFEVEAKTLREALSRAADMGVDKDQVNGALIYINGRALTGARRLSRRLHNGDELALLSPAGGG